jgi:hypothetical protein
VGLNKNFILRLTKLNLNGYLQRGYKAPKKSKEEGVEAVIIDEKTAQQLKFSKLDETASTEDFVAKIKSYYWFSCCCCFGFNWLFRISNVCCKRIEAMRML